MSTNDRLSFAPATAWLRAQVDRLRRMVMARRPAVRWGAACFALIALVFAVYWAAASLGTQSVRYLVSGRHFSSDDLITVCRTLDKHQVEYRVDDSRRIEVTADQFEQAADAIAKLNLGPRSVNEIREESIISNFFDTSADKERRRLLSREKLIEQLISTVPGVVWSLVSIDRPRARSWQHQGARPTAFVYIETEGKRRLSYQSVQLIPAIVIGCDSELTPGCLTVMDTAGNKYLESGNLAVGVDSHNRAREEELVGEILESLHWIKGVRVQVKVPARPIVEPTIPASGSAGNTNKTSDGLLKFDSGGPAPVMSINHPDSLEPEPTLPRLPAPAAQASANATDVNPPAGGRSRDHEKPPKTDPGQVLIYVPRSYYLNAEIRSDNREPTREDLRAMADRNEKQIKTAVSMAVPDFESWKVDIFTFPDEASLIRPVIVQSPVDGRRRVLDWGIVGTVVAALSILAAAGSWIRAARRPVVVPESALATRRFHVDSASEPGPSERVRELVRRNPEAAASVLQRWTGQGGRG